MEQKQPSKNEIKLEQDKSNDSSKSNNNNTDYHWKITMKQLLKTGCLINGDGPDSA